MPDDGVFSFRHSLSTQGMHRTTASMQRSPANIRRMSFTQQNLELLRREEEQEATRKVHK